MCEGALKDIVAVESPVADRATYQELLGCLLFIATRTGPDISATVSILCLYANPMQVYWIALKRTLRYLRGTPELALRIFGSEDSILRAYCDADWARDRVDRRSTTGVLLQRGGSTVAWKTLKQGSVALSTTEAGFVSLSEGTKLILWIRALLEELDCGQDGSATSLEDNKGAVVWRTEGVPHAKHVSIRKNFVKENVESGMVTLKYFPTQGKVADVLTKPLSGVTFEKRREGIGVVKLLPC